jgi:CBS domain-containing protein
MIPDGTKVLILRVREVRVLGSSGADAFRRFFQDMKQRGITVLLTGLGGDLERIVRSAGLIEEIGEENIFYADTIVFRSLQLAVARARSLTFDPRQSAAAAEGDPDRLLTVREIMRPPAMRFGVGHTLREALWLLHEGRRHKPDLQLVFPQGQDARLAGVLDLRSALSQILRAVPEAPSSAATGDAETLRACWRRVQNRRLSDVVRPCLKPLRPEHSLEQAIEVLETGLEVAIPVTQDGRVVGELRRIDMLRYMLDKATPKDLDEARRFGELLRAVPADFERAESAAGRWTAKDFAGDRFLRVEPEAASCSPAVMAVLAQRADAEHLARVAFVAREDNHPEAMLVLKGPAPDPAGRVMSGRRVTDFPIVGPDEPFFALFPELVASPFGALVVVKDDRVRGVIWLPFVFDRIAEVLLGPTSGADNPFVR